MNQNDEPPREGKDLKEPPAGAISGENSFDLDPEEGSE